MSEQPLSPPHGPMGLIEEPFYWLWFDYILLGLLGVLFGLLWLWYWRKKRLQRRRAQVGGAKAGEQIWRELETRVEELGKLLDESTTDGPSFVAQLSACLRTALDQGFGLKASRWTLSELGKQLSTQARFSREEQESLEDFFSWAERAQFAGSFSLSKEEAVRRQLQVSSWIKSWQRQSL